MKRVFSYKSARLCVSLWAIVCRSVKKVYRYRNLVFIAIFVLFLVFLNNNISKSPPWDDDESLHFDLFDIDPSIQEGKRAYDSKWVGFSKLSGVDCKRPLVNSTRNSLYPKSLPRIAYSDIALDSQNCSHFLNKYGFNRYPEVSKEERDFPIAFIILFHKDLDQVLFLLRAIYRSSNVYCFSVDLTSRPAFVDTVRSVTKCFKNVFVASKLEHIVYAGFSRFMADIHCMRDFLKHPVPWRYLINLPGQQFPLKTNLEIVKILRIYNGANEILGITGKRSLTRRYRVKHHVIEDKKSGDLLMQSARTYLARIRSIIYSGKKMVAETIRRNPPPPHKFKIVKGSAYGTYSRAFVKFVMEEPKVQDLIEWSKDIESPDEYFWATVHHTKIMDVPGGYKGTPDEKHALTTFVAWETESKCASMFVRWICIFSTADLPMLMARHELFANKFYIDHHPMALHCLDQFLYNMTVMEKTRDLQFYRKQVFIPRPQKHTSVDGFPDISML